MAGLAAAGVEIDVLVASSADSGELYGAGDLDPPPSVIARTAGAAGGMLQWADGRSSRWQAAPLPGPPVDAYGSGDSFAAGLTYGLAAGLPPERAVEVGARCGAACMAGRGPYEGQLTSPD
jgi:ribokinase